MVSGMQGALVDLFVPLKASAPVPTSSDGAAGAAGARFLDCVRAFAAVHDPREDELAWVPAPMRWPEPVLQPLPPPPLPSSSAAADAAPPTSRAAETPPLRLHLYQDAGGGLHAWLGADARLPDAVLLHVQATLRQALSREGAGLARLVCNGREIDLAAPPFARRRIQSEGRA